MILIPKSIFLRYIDRLKSRGIEVARHAEYIKWLRFYFDFCDKYPVPEDLSELVRLFMDKLRAKKQNEAQLKGAAHAVSLYFEMQRAERQSQVAVGAKGEARGRVYSSKPNSAQIQPTNPAEGETGYVVTKPVGSAVVPAARESAPPLGRFTTSRSHFIEEGYAVTTNSPEWDAVLAAMVGEIKLRHYSRKTLRTYALWARKFQRFLKNKAPQDLTTVEVKEYLTYLAVKSRLPPRPKTRRSMPC